LQRIFDISGLQARSYGALTDLLIVCNCNRHGAIGVSDAADPPPSGRASSR
jgi:hypothetical protein